MSLLQSSRVYLSTWAQPIRRRVVFLLDVAWLPASPIPFNTERDIKYPMCKNLNQLLGIPSTALRSSSKAYANLSVNVKTLILGPINPKPLNPTVLKSLQKAPETASVCRPSGPSREIRHTRVWGLGLGMYSLIQGYSLRKSY